ncbi:MAG: prepilin-type N-terminal cleavage/methylation domain-containing protein [Gemmatimonadota bacterium]
MRDTSGFTLMEMMVALVVAGVLSAIAVSGFGDVHGRLTVRSARAAFLSSHAHARALAVERGGLVSLVADAGSGVVSVQVGCDGLGAVLESRDFADSFAVELEVSGDALSLCMTPKGVASPALNSFNDEVEVAFVRGTASVAVVLFPLGQAVTP